MSSIKDVLLQIIKILIALIWKSQNNLLFLIKKKLKVVMKSLAEQNLKSINIQDVIDKIKNLNQGEFDKMIIDKDQIIQRCDYYYVNYKAISANRQSLKLNFPIYGQLADNMTEFEGGDGKHGELAYFPSDKILNILSDKFEISPVSDPLGSPSNFIFPLDTNGDSISKEQRNYFISDRTYKEQCDECSGNKLIKCDDFDCDGRHEWPCVDCNAKGVITCHKCAGNKRVDCNTCNGSNKIKCRSCGGDGKKVNKMDTISAVSSSTRSTRIVQKTCGTCSGKGKNQCTNCTSGKVSCPKCSGNGRLTCSDCDGHKKITCSHCYGDKERYGMIDCPQCKAQGSMGYISYVKTTINSHATDKLFNVHAKLDEISDAEVLRFANSSAPTVKTLTNINDNKSINRDGLVENYAESLMDSFNLSLDNFDKIMEEELYYQVIPCIQIKYKHMLTNKVNEISILNFFENPELKFHAVAEEVKTDIKDKGKKVGRFFGKMLKTKKFKSKDDRKKEIRLMIYLAKADGLIEEEEKLFLADNINSIEEFTSTEKTDFFTLMNTSTLPELSKEDVTFSSNDKLNEILDKLISLAGSDGTIEAAEQQLIDKIKSMN
jgi:tellurite resistance protein